MVARRTISAGTDDAVADRDRVGRIELADLRLDLEVDQAVLQHGRREGEADAVFLVLDRDLAERSPATGIGIFAAGEEARGVARQRDQVRLGEAAREAALLERVERHVDVETLGDQLPAIRKPNGVRGR